MSSPPFVQAEWFTATNGRAIDWIVLHDMEAPEKGTTAESCAAYFASGSGGRKASAHYACDDNSIVQCVRDKDVAYGAPGANARGLHIEHAGYASQGRDGWADAYSTAMLRDQSAVLCAALCASYRIPVRFVDAAGLRRGDKGITTHAECSKAFKPGGHTDPGGDFPLARYIAWVAVAAGHSTQEFTVDAEAKAEFAAIRKEQAAQRDMLQKIINGVLVGIAEARDDATKADVAKIAKG